MSFSKAIPVEINRWQKKPNSNFLHLNIVRISILSRLPQYICKYTAYPSQQKSVFRVSLECSIIAITFSKHCSNIMNILCVDWLMVINTKLNIGTVCEQFRMVKMRDVVQSVTDRVDMDKQCEIPDYVLWSEAAVHMCIKLTEKWRNKFQQFI